MVLPLLYVFEVLGVCTVLFFQSLRRRFLRFIVNSSIHFFKILTHIAWLGNHQRCLSPHHTSHFLGARKNVFFFVLISTVGGVEVIAMQLTKTENTYVKRWSALSLQKKIKEKKWNKLDDGEKSLVIYINIININNDSLWYYPSWLLFIHLSQCHIRRGMLYCSRVSVVPFPFHFSRIFSDFFFRQSTFCTLVFNTQLLL